MLQPDAEATAVPAEPPLGDCYGGVLSYAPLHCYALEQAEAAGVIDVDSIYLAGNRLYVFVGGEVGEGIPDYFVTTGNPTVGSDVYLGIAEEIKEFARLWPARVRYEWLLPWPDVCELADSSADCLVKKANVSRGRGVERMFDDVEGYDSLYLSGILKRVGPRSEAGPVGRGSGPRLNRVRDRMMQGVEGERGALLPPASISLALTLPTSPS